MSVKELTDLAHRENLFSDKLSGKTPHQTMKSKLSQDVRKRGADSVFVRTGPGRFYLRELVEPATIYEAPPLRAPLPAERVLIFPAAWLDRYGRSAAQAVQPDAQRLLIVVHDGASEQCVEKLLAGRIAAVPMLGGLRHRCVRVWVFGQAADTLVLLDAMIPASI
jgi:hypothetical protein